jgi:hypothetical protein
MLLLSSSMLRFFVASAPRSHLRAHLYRTTSSQQLSPEQDSASTMRAAHCPAKLHRADSESGLLLNPTQPPWLVTLAHSSIRSASSASGDTATLLLLSTVAQPLSDDLILSALKDGGSLLAHAANDSALSSFASRWHCCWRHCGLLRTRRLFC